MLLFIFLLVFFVSVTTTFEKRFRRTTIWAGRMVMILPQPQMSRGRQDDITPPMLTFLTILILCARLVILVAGTYFIAWYAGLLAIIFSIILSGIFGLFTPKELGFYLQLLLRDMKRRNTNYKRKQDFIRETVSNFLIIELSSLVSNKVILSARVPTTLEAMKATRDSPFSIFHF